MLNHQDIQYQMDWNSSGRVVTWVAAKEAFNEDHERIGVLDDYLVWNLKAGVNEILNKFDENEVHMAKNYPLKEKTIAMHN